MSKQVIISERFLEQYHPVLEVMKGCGYLNKIPNHTAYQFEKISGAETFWEVIQKSTAARHFSNLN